MKRDRAREFLFEPSRFKNDPAVMKMSLRARGAYAILFCEAWDMPEPGVMLADDTMLAVFARTDPTSWSEVRDEVATAFDTESRPGFWIQRGTVSTYEKQQQWFTGQIESGRQGGLKRASRVASRRAIAGLKGRSSGVVGVEGVVGVVKEKEDSDSVPSLISPVEVNTVRTRTGNVNGNPGPAFWNSPEVQAKLKALMDSGVGVELARKLVLGSEAYGR